MAVPFKKLLTMRVSALRSAQRVALKAIYTALLILTIEPLLLAINALPKSLLIPTETRILRLFGYLLQTITVLFCKCAIVFK